eukprot:scaffold175_cov414-Prasinococcus_capsulatus_cf.AAC.8
MFEAYTKAHSRPRARRVHGQKQARKSVFGQHPSSPTVVSSGHQIAPNSARRNGRGSPPRARSRARGSEPERLALQPDRTGGMAGATGDWWRRMPCHAVPCRAIHTFIHFVRRAWRVPALNGTDAG